MKYLGHKNKETGQVFVTEEKATASEIEKLTSEPWVLIEGTENPIEFNDKLQAKIYFEKI